MTGHMAVTDGKTYLLLLYILKLKASRQEYMYIEDTEKRSCTHLFLFFFFFFFFFFLIFFYFFFFFLQFVFEIKMKIIKIVLNGVGGDESVGLCTYTPPLLKAKSCIFDSVSSSLNFKACP